MSAYTHVQDAAATTWTINHNLASDSIVIDVMVDNAGDLQKAEPQTTLHKTANQTVLTFGSAESGQARLVGEIA